MGKCLTKETKTETYAAKGQTEITKHTVLTPTENQGTDLSFIRNLPTRKSASCPSRLGGRQRQIRTNVEYVDWKGLYPVQNNEETLTISDKSIASEGPKYQYKAGEFYTQGLSGAYTYVERLSTTKHLHRRKRSKLVSKSDVNADNDTTDKTNEAKRRNTYSGGIGSYDGSQLMKNVQDFGKDHYDKSNNESLNSACASKTNKKVPFNGQTQSNNRVVNDVTVVTGELPCQPTHPNYPDRRDTLFGNLSDSISTAAQPYKMDNLKRGDCIIFNVSTVGSYNRYGSDVDVQYLNNAFQCLGFYPKVVKNPTKQKIQQEIHDYTLRDHSYDDCFVCVILSHGREGHIRSTDDQEVSLDDIIEKIKNCRSLAGKPKLFFVQACRGNNIKHTLVPDAVGDIYNTKIKMLSTHFDVLVSYATIKDFVAFRDVLDGSIYIRILCSLIEEEGLKTKFTDLLQKVNYVASTISGVNFDGIYQVPIFTSTLRKPLLFTEKKKPLGAMLFFTDGSKQIVDADVLSKFVMAESPLTESPI